MASRAIAAPAPRSPGCARAGLRSCLQNTGALLIHALNPYGFAWTRRVTEDNVDLNRNFVDHDKGYPE